MRNTSNGTLTYKRLVCALVALTLMFLAVVPAMATDTYGTVRNPNGGATANLRKWASFDAPVLCAASVGTQVQVIRAEGDFYLVYVGNTAGYIHSGFVSIHPVKPSPSGKTATVSVGPLTVYDAPGTNAFAITTLSSGAQVTVLQPGNTWTQIRVGDVYGYVFTSYLIFDGTAPAPVYPAPKPPVATQNANASIRTKNGGNLNLRSDASSYAPIITSFQNGTRVRVITHGASWCKVQVGDLVGYMTTAFLAFDGMPNPSNPAPNKVLSGIVKSNLALNLRKEPSTASKSLGQFTKGTRVTVLGVGTEWLRVQVGGTIGYMAAKHIQLADALTPHKTVVNKGSYVNLRQGAGYDQQVIKQVSHGAAATIVVPYPAWSKVIVKDGTGFISGFMVNEFLK